MFKKLFQIVIGLACFTSAGSQTLTPVQYIELYKDLAIREMKRMGVPAAITLAQGLLETESGNSVLVKKSNNHFGIKCKNTWTGAGVSHDDDAIGECFRTYKTAEESFRDHSNFLRGSDRYAILFSLSPVDYKGWAYGLRKAGYATNPKYPEILIKNILQYDLQQYSLIAQNEVPEFNKENFEDDKEVPFVYVEDEADKKINPAIKPSGKNETATDLNTADQPVFINSLKCINAKKGTSLLAIATRNNIQLSKLLQFNELAFDGILERDQMLFLQKKSTQGIDKFYVVKKAETLYDVAQNNGMQLEYLLSYNQLNKGAVINEGSRLNLQPGQVTAALSNNEMLLAKNKRVHEVQPKEGLYSIAKKYNVTVQQIKDWNNLSSDNLSIGQQLIIK